jgi:hypothetical protein
VIVVVAALATVGACTVADDGADKADDGVVASRLVDIAEGRWRCRGTAEGTDQDLLIAITRDGRLGFIALDDITRFSPPIKFDPKTVTMPNGGTWKRKGLRLDLDIPWYGDGAHGFNRWKVAGDRPVPEHLEARPRGSSAGVGHGDDTDLRIRIGTRHVELVQVRAASGTVSPHWRLACTKLTAEPGKIAPRQASWTSDEGPP